MPDSEDPSKRTDAIVVAAGKGVRADLGRPKQFAPVAGKPMVLHSIEQFASHPGISNIWVVIGEGQDQLLAEALDDRCRITVVYGGETRQQSVRNGLEHIHSSGGAKNVLIHDAARPFLSHQVIDRLLDRLVSHSAAIPVIPTIDTTIKVSSDRMQDVIDRDTIWRVQTPQAFDFEALMLAHREWDADREVTDDAQIMTAAGHQVTTVPGDEKLKKYTTAQDFAGVSNGMNDVRTGMGYDVHRLAHGEELWLGGIKIDHDRGLAGHSDADVLLHALTDALLGAVGEGDIGDHFPPSDPKWSGAASHLFVEHAVSLIKQKGAVINNVDMTIICEAPKIKPHRLSIREKISKMLDISIDRVSVKATTTEGLGFPGRREGIAAKAITTISMEK